MKFSVGGVLTRTFDVYFKNFAGLMGISILANIPVFIVQAFSGPAASSSPESRMSVAVVGTVTSLISSLIMQAGVIFGVYEALNQRRIPVVASIKVALRRIGEVFLASLVVGIVTWLCFLLLIVPGIVAYTALWVTIPAVVVDRKGVGDAITRSRKLTTGFRMRIFGLTAILGIFAFVSTLIVLSINLHIHGIVHTLLGFAPGLFWGSVGAVSTAVGYYYLCMDVEGLELSELAVVFE